MNVDIPPKGQACVYYLWDEGTLVYVGQSCNFAARLASHQEDKVFDAVTVTWCDTRNQARALEAREIRRHRPAYNRVGHSGLVGVRLPDGSTTMVDSLPPTVGASTRVSQMSSDSTPVDKSLIASIAAHRRWAATPDRTSATAKARRAALARFESEVDPEGKLPPEVRAKLAANARSAYFKQLARKSAQARSRK